nr:hypothetical protein [Tanacetum cinerariifolium]
MEYDILASPTLTLRIHKDRPKSQIISPMDTTVQIRNKSKEMKEQSFIATIHQKTNPALLQFCLFSWVRPIGTKWVLKNKKDERGIVIRNKARLVAQGHTQEEEIDYDEVFTPVVRIKAIRLFLAYASFMGFTVYQMDVKSAFLYGTIDEEVYVMQPPGFQDLEFPARVYKVEKAIYGLHQALRASEFEALMHEKFQMSAMDELNFFLGLQVLQKKDGIFLSQDKTQVTPKECHLHAVKRIFRYLKGHPKLGLWYPKESPFNLVAYSDSDYGGATQDRKSTTEGCQFLEYVVAASGCRQVLWIKNQMLDYGHHFIRDCFEKKLISVDHIHIDDNVADLLTKPFDAGRFQYLVAYFPLLDQQVPTARYALTINPTVYVSHIQQFWSTARIETMDEGTKILATVDGTLTEPHHTPSPEAQQTSPTATSSPSLLLVTTATIPIVIPTNIPQLRQYIKRARIAQSSALLPIADEPASPFGDDSQDEIASKITAWDLEISALKAKIKHLEDKDGGGHDPSGEYATIKGKRLETGEESGIERSTEKGSDDTEEMVNFLTFLDAASVLSSRVQVSVPLLQRLPLDSTPRVTFLATDEGSMQHKLTELTDLCTRLQRQQDEIASKITAQDLEISALKARIKHLEDKDGGGHDPSGEYATIKGKRLETGEESGIERSTEKGSDDTEEMVNFLTFLDAASVLSSRVQVSVPPAAEVATVSIPLLVKFILSVFPLAVVWFPLLVLFLPLVLWLLPTQEGK